MAFVLLLLSWISCISNAAPLPRDTQFLSWQSEPNARGTWTILQTCVITMVLCVYNAVHMNVPAKGDSLTTRCLRRAGWITMGLLAPELVVFTAWRQWAEAKDLSSEIEKLRKKKSPPPSLAKWTLVHSFFVVMGGFALDKETSPIMREFSDLDRVTLTPRAILSLAKHSPEVLPSITAESIQDRSKADVTAKVLVSVQAGYLILQVTGRLVNHLSVTMLEVNTIGHVICALAMLAFWINKPLNVMEPITIMMDSNHKYLVRWLMDAHTCTSPIHKNNFFSARIFIRLGYYPREWMKWRQTKESFVASRFLGTDQIVFKPKLKKQVFFRYEHSTRADLSSDGRNLYVLDNPDLLVSLIDLQETITSSQLWSRTYSKIFLIRVTEGKPQSQPHLNMIYIYDNIPPMMLQLTLKGLARWSTVYDEKLMKEFDGGSSFTRVRCKDWYNVRSIQIGEKAVIAIIFTTAIYGGLHAICWNAHFPSLAENLIWRVSALFIAGSGIFVGILVALQSALQSVPVSVVYFFKDTFDTLRNKIHECGFLRDFRDMMAAIIALIAMTIGVLLLLGIPCIYVAARVFIVIESFISLRSLPPSAYQTPNWTPWFPHL